MFRKFEYDGKLNPTFVEGAFELPLSTINAYIKELVTPRFVHVGSAGVTQPDQPGLDISKQPPAVGLNKEGEDLIWESGVLYTIVRSCALTGEPARWISFLTRETIPREDIKGRDCSNMYCRS